MEDGPGPQKGRVQLRRRLLALLRMRTLIFGGRAFALPPFLRPHIAFAPRLCYTVRSVIRQGGLFLERDLTRGSIRKGLVLFSLPLIAGNLLQQCYNIVDTWVVGRFLGSVALAAVGSAFSLMTLLTSLLLGLCMGSGVVMSQLYGQGDREGLRRAMGNAFVGIALAALALAAASFALLDSLMVWMRVPAEAVEDLRGYLQIIFWGIGFTFLYNFFATALRSVGNSAAALWFLLCAAVMNIALDLWFVTGLGWGVEGAALATVIAQAASAAGIVVYSLLKMGDLRPGIRHLRPDGPLIRRIAVVSVLTGAQQSIMNFGILMIQSLVNSFGVNVMAAFAAGVKIDAFAYAPAQDFANGFATFVAQNAGAGRADRVRRGLREAAVMSLGFCALVSAVVGIFAVPLLSIFIDPSQGDVMAVGVHYLRTEGLCYVGIGLLFLLYATYRGLERAGMSIVLTVISLGLRVALAYWLAPSWGLDAVWWAIPIGWAVADATGLMALKHSMTSLRTR